MTIPNSSRPVKVKRRAVFQVFAKAPVPGFAKTRLIPLLGAAGAARLQALLVRHCLQTCCEAAEVIGGGVELWCAPDCSDAFFRRCATDFGIRLHPQTAGADLGRRMCDAMRAGLTRASAAILLGTDVPLLAVEHLINAARALAEEYDAVIAPAVDGGYVLMGLTRLDGDLFEGVTWGSGRVFGETRRRLQRCRYNWLELPAQQDLDTPEDWMRLRVVCPEWIRRWEGS